MLLCVCCVDGVYGVRISSGSGRLLQPAIMCNDLGARFLPLSTPISTSKFGLSTTPLPHMLALRIK